MNTAGPCLVSDSYSLPGASHFLYLWLLRPKTSLIRRNNSPTNSALL